MAHTGKGLKARIRQQAIRALDRPRQRDWVSARLRLAARDEDDDLADLRRLVEDRLPRSWHL